MTIRSFCCLLVLLVCSVGCTPQEEMAPRHLSEISTLYHDAKIVHNFSAMDQFFPTKMMDIRGTPTPMPNGKRLVLDAAFDDWRTSRNTTSIVVLKRGEVVFEEYYLGTTKDDQRMAWSVSKSYLSALLGVVVDRGHIRSIEDFAESYVPELKGTAYEGVKIRDLLQMSSGVSFNENYRSYSSDINRMGRSLAMGGSMDQFALSLDKRTANPGARWNYVSIDTHILGMVLRNATGKNLPNLMAQYILNPLGVHGLPYYTADKDGVAFALGGLNLTTRDYARFGEMIRLNGRFRGKQIVPSGWVQQSTTPSARTKPGWMKYGYQWWMPADVRDGEFFALGVYGQYIYVDRANGVVIAVNAADKRFGSPVVTVENIAVLRSITAKTGR